MITIEFPNIVNNDSLQIGDMAFFQSPTSLGGFNQQLSAPVFIGPVMAFTDTTITIDNLNPGGTTPGLGDFIMFGKDTSANISGLLGYFAEVELKNNSRDKAEIFSIASGITISSK